MGCIGVFAEKPMIPRILVPKEAHLLSAEPGSNEPRRTSTYLDERTVVQEGLSSGPLETSSNIPTYRPLDVLARRFVVPRDTADKPLDASRHEAGHVATLVLDKRIAVPEDLPNVALPSKAPVPVYKLPDVIDPDVMTTGEVTLMVKPLGERLPTWNGVVLNGAALAIEIMIISFCIFVLPRVFPYHGPTQADIAAAQRQLSWVDLNSLVHDLPKGSPAPPTPHVQVDPRLLRKLAPMPAPLPSVAPPLPQAQSPQRNLPDAPMPSAIPAPQPQETTAQNQTESPTIAPTPRPTTPNGLILPRASSPGTSLEHSMHDAMSDGAGPPSIGFQSRMPGGGGGGYPGGGGGGGGSYAGGIQMLTPTEGVDFSGYLARVLARVKQNWYAIMPESALMGDRGRVVLEFDINRDGTVPDDQPQMVGSSGKDPLDRAAYSSIRASSPFEPLPAEFSGPYIRLRFIYLYNLPLNEAQ